MSRPFLPAFLVAILAAFVVGAASQHLLSRDAYAQTTSSVSTIAVPWEGLVFRTPDGKAIARLSRDAHGGLLELYDDRQEALSRFSSGTIGPSHPAKHEPYVLDDEDPWATSGPATATPPSIGF